MLYCRHLPFRMCGLDTWVCVSAKGSTLVGDIVCTRRKSVFPSFPGEPTKRKSSIWDRWLFTSRSFKSVWQMYFYVIERGNKVLCALWCWFSDLFLFLSKWVTGMDWRRRGKKLDKCFFSRSYDALVESPINRPRFLAETSTIFVERTNLLEVSFSPTVWLKICLRISVRETK